MRVIINDTHCFCAVLMVGSLAANRVPHKVRNGALKIQDWWNEVQYSKFLINIRYLC